MGKPETPQKKQNKIIAFVGNHHSYGEAARKFKIAKSTAQRICDRNGMSSDFPAPAVRRGFWSRVFG